MVRCYRIDGATCVEINARLSNGFGIIYKPTESL